MDSALPEIILDEFDKLPKKRISLAITKNNFDDNTKTQSTTKLERYLQKDDDDTNHIKS